MSTTFSRYRAGCISAAVAAAMVDYTERTVGTLLGKKAMLR
jgi:hypothetical protein